MRSAASPGRRGRPGSGAPVAPFDSSRRPVYSPLGSPPNRHRGIPMKRRLTLPALAALAALAAVVALPVAAAGWRAGAVAPAAPASRPAPALDRAALAARVRA